MYTVQKLQRLAPLRRSQILLVGMSILLLWNIYGLPGVRDAELVSRFLRSWGIFQWFPRFFFPTLLIHWSVLPRPRPNLLAWFGLSLLGWLIGISIDNMIQAPLDDLYRINSTLTTQQVVTVVIPIVHGGVLGTLIGTAQWLLIRRRLRTSGWWIVLIAISYILADLLALAIWTLFW